MILARGQFADKTRSVTVLETTNFNTRRNHDSGKFSTEGKTKRKSVEGGKYKKAKSMKTENYFSKSIKKFRLC
jgi:hypothetical protein